MAFLDRLRGVLSGQRLCMTEHLAGYRRLGEQVFEVEVEMNDVTNKRALVLLRVAKSLQVMGDALLQDVLQSDDTAAQPIPVMTHEQAEGWYKRIPDLLVAARQEAAFEGSAKVSLPVHIPTVHDEKVACPVSHLAGMRRAADAMENLVKDKLAFARTQGDLYKEVILLYEEARTRRQAGDAIVGSIMTGQRVSQSRHEEGEEQYGMALSAYLLIAQALENPEIMTKRVHPSTTRMSRLDSRDVFKVTSKTALREIRRSGEYTEAQADLMEMWQQHDITEIEREYENTVDELLSQGLIREDGYWYCCPFQPVYRVLNPSVHVVNFTVPQHHVFVWDYGEDGAPGRFVTKASFGRADSRHYCED